MRPGFLLVIVLQLAMVLPIAAHAQQRGRWLAGVPTRETTRQNPYHGQPEAIAAGHRLFSDHCAPCHGNRAQGTRNRPTLISERVQQQATEGDLRWFLRNGNLKRGMPSWSRLPDEQLWQIISYLKSLSH
jgi:mono/diheme cytochrome c family protein